MYCTVICDLLWQGLGSDVAIQKIRDTFWTALKMNWKIWTVFQYINVNYVPLQVSHTDSWALIEVLVCLAH